MVVVCNSWVDRCDLSGDPALDLDDVSHERRVAARDEGRLCTAGSWKYVVSCDVARRVSDDLEGAAAVQATLTGENGSRRLSSATPG